MTRIIKAFTEGAVVLMAALIGIGLSAAVVLTIMWFLNWIGLNI